MQELCFSLTQSDEHYTHLGLGNIQGNQLESPQIMSDFPVMRSYVYLGRIVN